MQMQMQMQNHEKLKKDKIVIYKSWMAVLGISERKPCQTFSQTFPFHVHVNAAVLPFSSLHRPYCTVLQVKCPRKQGDRDPFHHRYAT